MEHTKTGKKEKKGSTLKHKLKQGWSARMLFLVIYEFLADRWKKQMFISSSSSAFIYIYLPFQ